MLWETECHLAKNLCMYKPEPGKRNQLCPNTLWSEENFVIIVVTDLQPNLASCVVCVCVCVCVCVICLEKAAHVSKQQKVPRPKKKPSSNLVFDCHGDSLLQLVQIFVFFCVPCSMTFFQDRLCHWRNMVTWWSFGCFFCSLVVSTLGLCYVK